MARASNLDPFDRFRFLVDVDGFTRSGFTMCSAPGYTIEKKEYKEGGRHLNPLVIVDGVTYKTVTLSRGVNTDTSFNKWATGFIDVVQNNQALTNNASQSFTQTVSDPSTYMNAIDGNVQSVPSNSGDINTYTYRRMVKIFHTDRTGTITSAYFLYNAFPVEYMPASEFDASSNEISIETLVLAYEGFEVKYSGIEGTLGSLAAQSLSGL